MKKFLAVMLIITVAFLFSGCDNDGVLEQTRAFIFGGEIEDESDIISEFEDFVYEYISASKYGGDMSEMEEELNNWIMRLEEAAYDLEGAEREEFIEKVEDILQIAEDNL